MLCNCKKCQHVWEQVGFTDKNGIPLDSTYPCPRCGTMNGFDIREYIRELNKKMGLKEPKFYD